MADSDNINPNTTSESEAMGKSGKNDMDVSESVVDIKGDGGVIKEIIKEGTGWETPEKGSEVTG